MGRGLVLVHEVVVDFEHPPPFVLAEHKPILPPVPAVSIASRMRGRLLAGIGDEHVPKPMVITEEHKSLPVLVW